MRLTVFAITACLLTSCFDSDDLDPPNETGAEFRTYDEGELWSPCWRGPDGAELGGWGCYANGAALAGPGSGLACYKPDSGRLDICVPQTWDPNTPADCKGFEANFGIGVAPDTSGSYCVVTCRSDADCESADFSPPRACSAQGTCAYVFLGT